MIRRLLGRVAVVATVVGMIAPAPMAVAGAAPAVPSVPSGGFCGFLDDGSGAGSAASLPPNSPLDPGTAFQQVNAGAWQLCYAPNNNGELTLYAYQLTWCVADDSGVARLRSCNGNQDQRWFGFADDYRTSFQVVNFNGGYLCAFGGVGTIDQVVPLSGCSSYHSTWRWQTSP